MATLDWFVLVAYFAVMIAVGLWSMRRVGDQEDYFMGGRQFGKWMQTFAAFGAGTGAHEPVTVGRTVWTSGLSGVWSAMMWLFVTPVYWITAVWYRRMRHLTLGDWFVERYQSRAMGAAYAIFAIVFYMFYLSTMLSAIAKFAAPLLNVGSEDADALGWILIPAIALIVMVYGVLGGLRAAYVTDLIQGVFIIVLSVMLIPSGLAALVQKFGDGRAGVSGWTILHERVSPDFFQLFGGPAAGEFPLHYTISLTVLVLVGIVVQPHFITTGGGSAKTETEARVGLVVGNFLKRLCTIGWALTALIAVALLADQRDLIDDPDQVWGVAAREILGPMKWGLVGLMLSCLLAAVMSSADTYMIVTSGLVVRNLYAAYVEPDGTEKRYLLVARLTGAVVIVGAAVIAVTVADVFGQFKMAVEIPLIFAAPFWIGMVWRRATTTAAWVTMATTLVVFFVLPYALPIAVPSLRPAPMQIDFRILDAMGFDLTQMSNATLESLRLPLRVAAPFVLLILVSLVTRRNDPGPLDRYYAKMRTEVDADPARDAANLAAVYTDPSLVAAKRLFRHRDLEIGRPRRIDVFGFLASVLACVAILAVLVAAANWGG